MSGNGNTPPFTLRLLSQPSSHLDSTILRKVALPSPLTHVLRGNLPNPNPTPTPTKTP